MLNEKQIATIIVKVRLRKGGNLRRYVRGYTYDREALRGRLLDYLHNNLRFARCVHKSGMSIEKLVTILQHG